MCVENARALFRRVRTIAADGQSRVLITCHGKPDCAVVSIPDLEALERLDGRKARAARDDD